MPVANVPTPAANRGPFPNLRCSESSLCNQSWSTLLSSKGTLACARSRFFGGTDFSLCIFPYFFTSSLLYFPFSNSFPIEFHRRSRSIHFQRPVNPHRIRPNKNPILPSRQSPKNTRLKGFVNSKTKIR